MTRILLRKMEMGVSLNGGFDDPPKKLLEIVCTIFSFCCIFQIAAAFLNPFASVHMRCIDYLGVYAQLQILLYACTDADLSFVQLECLNATT